MDWNEKQECVLCDEGGNVLICSGDGCPISVHKSCMGCEASFDDAGNFHCPYCVYKQITAETSRLREEVMLNKKNLSVFLEENVKDDNHQEAEVVMSDEGDEVPLKDKAADENDLVCDDAEKHQQLKTPVSCDETRESLVFGETNVNTCMIMVIYEPKTNPGDKQTGNDDKQTGNDASVDEEGQLEVAVLSSSSEKKITHKKRSRSVKSNYGKKRKEECVKEDLKHAAETLVTLYSWPKLQPKPDSKINIDDSIRLLDQPNGAKQGSLDAKTSGVSTTKKNDTSNAELKDSSKQVSVNDNDRSIMLPLPSLKHRVFWSEEEEDMLKEGVQKFSSVARKNLPWKKILDFGRHVFDSSRNPSDLKDKWRKLAK